MTAAPSPDFFNTLMSENSAFRENPFPLLGMLRENQPLIDTGTGFWVVSRYEDVSRLLRSVNGGMRSSTGAPHNQGPS